MIKNKKNIIYNQLFFLIFHYIKLYYTFYFDLFQNVYNNNTLML